MNDSNATPIRGVVIQTPGGHAPGLIAADGRQWPFVLENVWRSPVALAPNQTVEFTSDANGAVVHVVVVSAQQLAGEKLRQATSAATAWAQGPGREKLREVGDKGQAAFDSVNAGAQAQREARAASAAQAQQDPSGALADSGKTYVERMGKDAMVCCVALIVAWFGLSVVSMGLGVRKGFSVFDLLGLVDDLLARANGTTPSVHFGFVGLVAVLLLWATPLVRSRAARLFFCAPLAMLIVAIICVILFGQNREVTEAVFSMMQPQLEFGLWILSILCLIVAGIGLKRFAAYKVKHAVAVLVFMGAFPLLADRAQAEDGLNESRVAPYGGTYSTDCADPRAPRIRITENEIVLERGSRQVRESEFSLVFSTFGQMTPPKGFQVEFMSRLGFFVFKDRLGLYLDNLVDPDDPTAIAILAGDKRKFRDCDWATRKMPEPEEAATADTILVPGGIYELLKKRDPTLMRAYRATMGRYLAEEWLAKFDGPQTSPTKMGIANVEYLVDGVCKPHDCADNNAVVLYDGAHGVVYAMVRLKARRPVVLGNPPPAVARELRRSFDLR